MSDVTYSSSSAFQPAAQLAARSLLRELYESTPLFLFFQALATARAGQSRH